MTFLLLALISASAQDIRPAVRETAFGYTYTRPQGWNRRQLPNSSIMLTPPGPDSLVFSLMFMPGQANVRQAGAAHDQLFGGMTRGSTLISPKTNFTLSGWQCSESGMRTAQGYPLWTGLCTVVRNRRMESLMTTAPTEARLQAFRPAVEEIIASIRWPGEVEPSVPAVAAGPPRPVSPSPAAAGPVIHGLVIPYPSTWVRRDDPSGAVNLVPPQMEGARQYFISVLPSSPLSGTHWETHRALVREIERQVQWSAEPVRTSYTMAPGPFIRTEIAGRVPSGGIYQVQLYTAAHDGVMESVVGVNGIDRNVVDPVLEAVTFARGTRPERPRIAEAYRRIEQRTYINPSGGAQTAGSLQYERIWLLANGVADFSTSYPAGYAASAEPGKVDASLMSGDYGRWEAAGNQVRVFRSGSAAPVVYERQSGGLRSGATLWEPMPRVDGLKLSGRYAIRSAPNEAASFYWWVEFTPDGRFTTDGLLRAASANDGRPKPPERGSGIYEIRDWTIFFRFADGFTWSTDFSILGRDLNNFSSIMLQTSAYPRER